MLHNALSLSDKLLLPQCTPGKLSSKHQKYTIDPNTRYNYWTVSAQQFQVFHLYNREEGPLVHQQISNSSDGKVKRRGRLDRRKTVQVTVRPNTATPQTTPSATPITPPTADHGKLLNWARESTCGYNGVRVSNLTTSWRNGLAFAALLHRYRPDKLNFTAVSKCDQVLDRVFSVTEREFGIVSPFTPKELSASSIPDRQKVVQYLSALQTHFTSKESKVSITAGNCYVLTPFYKICKRSTVIESYYSTVIACRASSDLPNSLQLKYSSRTRESPSTQFTDQIGIIKCVTTVHPRGV
eukprot:sb/3467413/